MTAHTIQSWCGPDCVEVLASTSDSASKHGPVVTLRQNSGGMSFHHFMTPDQARDMAQVLIDCAAESERVAQKAAA